MHLKPSSQMEFTYKKMFTCFAELFLSGPVLILTSLNSKTKANKAAVAASIVTILGKYHWFMFSLLCFSSSTDVLLLHALLKTLNSSILSPHLWTVFTIHLVHSQLWDCVCDLWAIKWDKLMLMHICGAAWYGWNVYKAHVEEWDECVGNQMQQKLILISRLFS